MYRKIICEIWKPLIIYNLREGYWISSFGNLYDSINNYYIKPCYTQDGYQQVTLRCKDGTRKNVRINRAVLMTFEPIMNPELMEVNHKDTNRFNNFRYNLEWLTKSENNKYCYTFGTRNNNGENNPNCKITESIACMIHEYKLQGLNTTQIINILGMETTNSNRVLVNRVLRGDTWKDVYYKYHNI